MNFFDLLPVLLLAFIFIYLSIVLSAEEKKKRNNSWNRIFSFRIDQQKKKKSTVNSENNECLKKK